MDSAGLTELIVGDSAGLTELIVNSADLTELIVGDSAGLTELIVGDLVTRPRLSSAASVSMTSGPVRLPEMIQLLPEAEDELEAVHLGRGLSRPDPVGALSPSTGSRC